MKAFLLTAGLGTRLLPLTSHTPKCLVPIYGRPLIDWWFDALAKAGVTEVLINLHHLPDQVKEHVGTLPTTVKTTFFYEEILLGSAGTIRANFDFVKDEKTFFIIYGDNLTSLPLKGIYQYHSSQPHPLTVALFHANKPSSCGIAEVDPNGTIIDFVEKPSAPVSNLANAGIYVASPEIIQEISTEKMPCDIGFDLLPLFVNRMSGWLTNDYLIDIGTLENLEKARKEWPGVVNNSYEL
jgi:mannose-1-phosphate guanylyltransferase